MKILLILLVMAGLVACNNRPEAAAPSTKGVDSVVAAAPDTIKPMPVDSGGRKARPN
jgi:hypothetical protein